MGWKDKREREQKDFRWWDITEKEMVGRFEYSPGLVVLPPLFISLLFCLKKKQNKKTYAFKFGVHVSCILNVQVK